MTLRGLCLPRTRAGMRRDVHDLLLSNLNMSINYGFISKGLRLKKYSAFSLDKSLKCLSNITYLLFSFFFNRIYSQWKRYLSKKVSRIYSYFCYYSVFLLQTNNKKTVPCSRTVGRDTDRMKTYRPVWSSEKRRYATARRASFIDWISLPLVGLTSPDLK